MPSLARRRAPDRALRRDRLPSASRRLTLRSRPPRRRGGRGRREEVSVRAGVGRRGALWEWPPAVCGYHRDQTSLARSKAWAMVSYQILSDLARDPSTGVFMRKANFYFTHEQTARELHKMNELAPKIRGFVHDPGLAGANGIDPAYGVSFSWDCAHEVTATITHETACGNAVAA